MPNWLKRYVKRGVYAFGPTRRFSYKVWPPAVGKPPFPGCNSLIHVGANEGQERYLYESMGLEVLWVEPIPEVFSVLKRNIRGVRKQRATKALLSDKRGQIVTLNVSSNSGASSSIFELAEHKMIWPDVHYIDRIKCVSTTLDDLLPLLPFPGALVVDTQGSELMVLAGGERTLRHVRTVKVEAADFMSYQGACSDVDLIDFLTPRGFRLVERRRFADHPAGGGYFDLMFSKVR
jgi:FkbM family methyltransferase